jgi:hypothetical protein
MREYFPSGFTRQENNEADLHSEHRFKNLPEMKQPGFLTPFNLRPLTEKQLSSGIFLPWLKGFPI